MFSKSLPLPPTNTFYTTNMSPIAVTPAPAVAAPLYHETLGGGTFKVKVRFSPDRALLRWG